MLDIGVVYPLEGGVVVIKNGSSGCPARLWSGEGCAKEIKTNICTILHTNTNVTISTCFCKHPFISLHEFMRISSNIRVTPNVKKNKILHVGQEKKFFLRTFNVLPPLPSASTCLLLVVQKMTIQ